MVYHLMDGGCELFGNYLKKRTETELIDLLITGRWTFIEQLLLAPNTSHTCLPTQYVMCDITCHAVRDV